MDFNSSSDLFYINYLNWWGFRNFGWEVTVISSNFIALQLIITMSIVLHLIERYRELNVKYKHASQYKLVINTVLSKLEPSFLRLSQQLLDLLH